MQHLDDIIPHHPVNFDMFGPLAQLGFVQSHHVNGEPECESQGQRLGGVQELPTFQEFVYSKSYVIEELKYE